MQNYPRLDLDKTRENDMCFGCGQANPIGLKLKFDWDGTTARAEFTPGLNHQGWSGYMHGGITACVLDEAIGWAAMLVGYNNLTAKMQTRYRKMIPIGQPLIVTCTVTKNTARLIETEARLTAADGTVMAEATSIQFVVSAREESPAQVKNNLAKAVIWDMDGVIADTADQHFQSWIFAFQEQGVTFSREAFKKHFGQRNDITIGEMLGARATPELIEAVAHDKEIYFRQHAVGHTLIFAGVEELLQRLERLHIVSALASSSPLENIHLILKELKIEDYFRAIVYGLEVSEGKPSPQGFLLAARKLQVEPANCLVIEDAIAGIAAAKNAGMKCIAVTNSHAAQLLTRADMIVSTLQLVGIDDISKLLNLPAKR
jgi:beta-phosphoglucomutase family hydrolase